MNRRSALVTSSATGKWALSVWVSGLALQHFLLNYLFDSRIMKSQMPGNFGQSVAVVKIGFLNNLVPYFLGFQFVWWK
jgi:hypothetical protein